MKSEDDEEEGYGEDGGNTALKSRNVYRREENIPSPISPYGRRIRSVATGEHRDLADQLTITLSSNVQVSF